MVRCQLMGPDGHPKTTSCTVRSTTCGMPLFRARPLLWRRGSTASLRCLLGWCPRGCLSSARPHFLPPLRWTWSRSGRGPWPSSDGAARGPTSCRHLSRWGSP
eukprot:13894461-Alexandrium_andersonii.AAC.1